MEENKRAWALLACLAGLIAIAAFAAGCEAPKAKVITSFEECVAAGNPVMESYPRQCRSGDQIFTEKIEQEIPTQDILSDEKHYCTEEQKTAEMCTMEYAPVCGDNGVTYSNGCVACSSGEIAHYLPGEC